MLKNILIIKQNLVIKFTNFKNRMNYFFDDMINIKNFDSNLLKICNKLYKKIYSVNPLYLIIGKADGHIEKKIGVNI